jgi:hypothetical protein
MIHSDLVKVDVQGPDILVAMRGTCFRVRYRKQESPWLVAREYGPDDPGATVTLSEFRDRNFEHSLGQQPTTRRASSGGSFS